MLGSCVFGRSFIAWFALVLQSGLGPAMVGVMFLIPSAIIILMAPLIGHLIDVYHVSMRQYSLCEYVTVLTM